MRLSLAGSKTELMGGMIRHVTVMDIMIRTMCAPLQADIEIVDRALALLAGTIDVVMLVPLVVAIALSTETMVAEARAAKVLEEVEVANTVNEVPRIATVGVIVLTEQTRSCRLQVPRVLSMSQISHQTTSKVNPSAASPDLSDPC